MATGEIKPGEGKYFSTYLTAIGSSRYRERDESKRIGRKLTQLFKKIDEAEQKEIVETLSKGNLSDKKIVIRDPATEKGFQFFKSLLDRFRLYLTNTVVIDIPGWNRIKGLPTRTGTGEVEQPDRSTKPVTTTIRSSPEYSFRIVERDGSVLGGATFGLYLLVFHKKNSLLLKKELLSHDKLEIYM